MYYKIFPSFGLATSVLNMQQEQIDILVLLQLFTASRQICFVTVEF